MTDAEFYEELLTRIDYQNDLLLIVIFGVICAAAAGSFQIILYAARNKNFWGCLAFTGLSLGSVHGAEAGCVSFTPGSYYCFTNITFTRYACGGGDGTLYAAHGTANYQIFYANGDPLGGVGSCTWIVHRYRASGAFFSCQIHGIPYGGTIYEEYLPDLGFEVGIPTFPGDCPECGPYDGGAVGLNCCPSGHYGATWYVAKDHFNCDFLACNTANCQECPPDPDLPPEGAWCECPEGEIGGVVVFTYDLNGCPVGWFCDSCEPCPPLTPQQEALIGQRCSYGGMDGIYMVQGGADGCDEVYCNVEVDLCEVDANRDGVPDYLEGNPYRDIPAGTECTCENGQPGKVISENNEDGCPVPKCGECEEPCEDEDNDECCDDEDPDPEDPDVKCDDCDLELGSRISSLIGQFRAAIDLTESSYSEAPDSWTFEVNATQPIPGVVVFGLRFGGDLTSGTFWFENPGNSSSWDSVFGEFYSHRNTLRGLCACGVYLAFFYSVLTAAFHPAR